MFPLDSPTIIFEDNTASIALSSPSGTPHKRSKHFGVEWCMFRECVELGEVELKHISTHEQIADILTKPLGIQKFVKFRNLMLGGYDIGSESVSALMFCVQDMGDEQELQPFYDSDEDVAKKFSSSPISSVLSFSPCDDILNDDLFKPSVATRESVRVHSPPPTSPLAHFVHKYVSMSNALEKDIQKGVSRAYVCFSA